MTKERPILFSAPMVRAILEDRKTQTRRIIKSPKKKLAKRLPVHVVPFIGNKDLPTWKYGFCMDNDRVVNFHGLCPYGKPGDRLWVRETFAHGRIDKLPHPCKYRADHPDADTVPGQYGRAWTPSIHMPRWASRIDLLITNVRVERLQDISEGDAKNEGLTFETADPPFYYVDGDKTRASYADTPRRSFAGLWESINGKGSWDANPWVWVVEFERVKP